MFGHIHPKILLKDVLSSFGILAFMHLVCLAVCFKD